MNEERLIDEMAVILLEVPELGNDLDCIRHLKNAGFPGITIHNHLDAARALAREVRKTEGELWYRMNLV